MSKSIFQNICFQMNVDLFFNGMTFIFKWTSYIKYMKNNVPKEDYQECRVNRQADI